ncbi:glutamine amidotransferase [Micromonospora sp. NPDC006766]|uniref:glutamine amidotransferase n=1 Tax=Micromonospora sp. NPDC006766 TaxID=3154778 RepID=UPI0033F0FCCA
MTRKSVLIAGESWTVHSIHQKGFDSFTTTEYAEGVRWLRQALEDGGWQVTYQPAHVAATDFPSTVEELNAYDCVIISDVGANNFLLHPETFTKSVPRPDRLAVLRDWVHAGGGVIMVGGYLTFQGIDGKARYAGTAIEEALPVTMHPYDDRSERPAGVTPAVKLPEHAAIRGVTGPWPDLLGYNVVQPRPEADVVVAVDADPLVVTWDYGKGRGLAFTSDCGPHWAPPAFTDWDGYAPLWQQMVSWTAGEGR